MHEKNQKLRSQLFLELLRFKTRSDSLEPLFGTDQEVKTKRKVTSNEASN